MTYDAVLSDYQRFDYTDPQGRWTRPVWRRGTGPAVIVIHEMPGLHPLVIRFANRVAAAGMTVFCPSLFGDPGRPASVPYALGPMAKAIWSSMSGRPTSLARSSIGCGRLRPAPTPNAAGRALVRSACASPEISPWR